MVNNWKSRDPEEWAELIPIFRSIYEEVGAERFEECTRKCIRYHRSQDGRSFAPSVSEWEVWMPKPEVPVEMSHAEKVAMWKRESEGQETYGMADVAEMMKKAMKEKGIL
jgi:hypothetical protein